MVLRAVIYLSILPIVLVACTTVPAPAPETSKPSTPAAQNKTQIETKKQSNIVAPLVKQPLASIPLSSELKQQAEKSLHDGQWQQAILLAERGLRIDRKEPFFYWILSAAYQKLSKIQQSIDFARQGLRYVSGDIGLKNQLMSLSTQ